MKTIYLNQAIISYVEFMRKVIDMKNNPNDKTKTQYHDFITYYRELKNNLEIKPEITGIHNSTLMNPDLVKIYYINMPQLWAFLHLVLERKLNKELSLSFGYYKSDDFLTIKNIFKSMWFIKNSDYSCSYIYLEDKEHKVDEEIKILHTKMSFEQLQKTMEKTVKACKATRFKIEEFRNRIA